MTKMMQNNYLKYGIILLVGLLLGWIIFGGTSQQNAYNEPSEHKHESADEEVWTCSMHPHIKQNKPGKCPICAMDLIPLKTSGGGSGEMIDPDALQLSKEAAALANIQTTTVSRQKPVKDIQLYGTIQADERLSQSQTSHVNGRIEKLLINFTGETVRQGQILASIYSPELLSAQQELLEAVKMQEVSPDLVQAAREKLRLWKLSEEQMEAIEASGVVSPVVNIHANTNGVVVNKKVNQGDYVNQGAVLFDLVNLSKVWAVFDVYEADLPFLQVGNQLEYTLKALPGKTFPGKISFINPILDPTTRTAKVRVETANSTGELKPEMYANARIKAPLKQHENVLVVPKSAVLWTGKRSVVYVKQIDTESPVFKLREITLGPSLGASYVVIDGIEDGEEIVTNGAFTIDASAQLEGKRSMMNTETTRPMTGHEGHDMSAHSSEKMPADSSGEMTRASLLVKGSCVMCKTRIEETAKAIDGVHAAKWMLDKKDLQVRFNLSKTNVNAISQALAKAGHDTEKHQADQAAYDALPACCHYR